MTETENLTTGITGSTNLSSIRIMHGINWKFCDFFHDGVRYIVIGILAIPFPDLQTRCPNNDDGFWKIRSTGDEDRLIFPVFAVPEVVLHVHSRASVSMHIGDVVAWSSFVEMAPRPVAETFGKFFESIGTEVVF
jgi:hypothetical protein